MQSGILDERHLLLLPPPSPPTTPRKGGGGVGQFDRMMYVEAGPVIGQINLT